jgi:IS605 OrfB family transposase
MSEKLVRTVCVKLDVGAHGDVLARTMRTFNEAAWWIAQVCWSEEITNPNTAHHRVYHETRAQFGLGSQLAVCARAKAVEAIKAGKQRLTTTCPVFGPRGSVRYDARTYRLLSLDRVSLNTLEGRVLCRLLPGHRQHLLLVDPLWRIGGADLAWREGTYYLHITQHRPAPPTAVQAGILGVDLGQVNQATDSDGDTYSGAKVKGLRAYYHRRRQILQKVGTKSATRKMRRTRRREQRMMRDVNHRISKALVAKAASACKALSLEDLTHIRERTTVRHERRYQHHSWAFFQLRAFLAYKAAAAGVPVVLVDPRNTSRTCQRCGHCAKANRHNQATFLCCSCGYACNADWNAAVNIARRAAVNRPMVSPPRAAGTSCALLGRGC